ncbi:MAG: hypothetical protein ABI840_04530 [bacterium]
MLSPFGARIVSQKEDNKIREKQAENGNPNASVFRERLFKQFMAKGFYPAHIIDVGAHKGYWRLDAQKIFPDCSFTISEESAKKIRL